MKLLIKLLLTILILTTINASEQTPTQEEVAKLYVATFNRAPDSAGLSYWVNNSGLTLSGIAKSFFVQTETQALYPEGTTVRAFIQSVYQNLFNRAPDSGGLKYWEDDFNLRGRTRDSFILAMINGAKDNADGMDKTILNNKNEVGLYFANAGLGEYDFPTEVMSGVTADSDTVTFIKDKIDIGTLGADVWDDYNEITDYDYTGTWSGKAHAYVNQYPSIYCKWNLTMTISSNNTFHLYASLYEHSGDVGECVSDYVDGTLTNISNTKAQFNITNDPSDVFYATQYNFVRNNNRISSSQGVMSYGYAGTMSVYFDKQ